MTKNIPYKNIAVAICIGFTCMLLTSFLLQKKSIIKSGHLKINFINTANGKPIFLRDSLYTNPFGEQYSISKLKYYISNLMLTGKGGSSKPGGYYLVNASAEDNSFELTIPTGSYQNIQFLLGVDSLHNCSGAQDGALDPLNDMFWTWNSGYVMFKLEGSSTASTADLNRIEHHVGGYKGANNVVTPISLNIDHELNIDVNTTTALCIETNLDHYWQGNADIKIAELPVCVIPGKDAKKIASNFEKLFSIKNIQASH